MAVKGRPGFSLLKSASSLSDACGKEGLGKWPMMNRNIDDPEKLRNSFSVPSSMVAQLKVSYPPQPLASLVVDDRHRPARPSGLDQVRRLADQDVRGCRDRKKNDLSLSV